MGFDGVNMVGPSTSNEVMNGTTFNGAMGKANDTMDRAAIKLFNKDEFDLSGKSRLDKFTNTISTFTKGGACAGALVGGVATAPYDFVMGRGRQRDGDEKAAIMDKGLVGHTLRGATAVTSAVAEVGGGVVGATVGGVSLPASFGSSKSPSQWVGDGASGGAQAAGKTTAYGVGTVTGLALSAARLPSVVAKYTLAGVFAVCGAVVGFLGGSVRAIANR